MRHAATARARSRPGRRAAALALAVAAGPATLPGPLLAQDEGSGPRITAEISQSFEVDSNYGLDDPRPGTSYFADTGLALGLLNETPTQVFALDFNTGLRALWEAEEDFEFTFASPSAASAAYAREWSNAALESRFRYRQARVDFDRPLDFLDPDVIDPDTGEPLLPDDPAAEEGDTTQRRYDAEVGLELATDAPSSYAFGLAASRIDYSDEADDRIPRDTVDGDATWNLQLTPLIASALTARYFFYEADDDEETRITEAEVTAGLVYTPSETLRVSGGIGFVDRQREEIAGGERITTEDDTGLAFRSGVRYDFEEFVLDASLRLSTVPDTRVSGDLRFIYPLLNAQVTGRVFQDYVGGSGGDEIRITGAGIGLLRDLDAVSRVAFDVAASRRENQDDPGDPDADRIDFTSTYSYDFTEALTGDIGYRYRRLDEDPDTAQSHAVFVQVSRAFETRP